MNIRQGNLNPNNIQKNLNPKNRQKNRKNDENLKNMQVLINKLEKIKKEVEIDPDIPTTILTSLLVEMQKRTKYVTDTIDGIRLYQMQAEKIERARNQNKYKKLEYTDEDIANSLGISYKLVKNYIKPRSLENEMKFAIRKSRNYWRENNQINELYKFIQRQVKNGKVLNETRTKNSIRNIISSNNSLKQQIQSMINLLK